MNKKVIVEKICNKTNISKTNVEAVLKELVNVIYEGSKSDKVSIPGLGTFTSSLRKARTGINPLTKESIKIPARTVPKFKAAKALKDAVA